MDSDLVEVDRRLPVVVSQKVEVSHTDLSEVTKRILATPSKLHRRVREGKYGLHDPSNRNGNVPRVVFIHVGSVVMLTTSKTTTSWVLAVLSYTTMTGGNVAAAEIQKSAQYFLYSTAPNILNRSGCRSTC